MTKRKDEKFEMRVSADDLAAFSAAAELGGESLSGWARRHLLQAAAQALGTAALSRRQTVRELLRRSRPEELRRKA